MQAKTNSAQPEVKRLFRTQQNKGDDFNHFAIGLMFFVGIAIAGVYDTWTIGIGVGGLSVAAYLVTYFLLPNVKLYQYVAAVVYAVFMAQFIYQMHGMFEMHFFAFIGSGLLMAYQNWRLQIPLLLVVAIHHSVFAWLQFSGNSEIFFTQLDYMDLSTFMVHVVLAAVIIGMNAWWGYVAEQTTKELSQNNQTLSKQVKSVKKNIAFAREIQQGNLEVEYELSDDDEMGASLLDMRKGLVKAAKREEEEKFVNLGIAKIADIMRTNMDNVSGLAKEVLAPLIKYLDANQGGIFILHDEEGEGWFELVSCYAYNRQKYMNKRVEVSEGLIGAAYLEGEPIYMTALPKDHMTIRSGLGDASPRCLFIVPMKSNDETIGVLELASFQPLEEYKRDFVVKVCQDIAAMIVSTKVNEQTNRLLTESRQMAEEMQAQEEEMRQNMEEMQATQEQMKRGESGLKDKEANLKALINTTGDRIFAIDRDYIITVVNDVLREMYSSADLAVEEGKSVKEFLKGEQWKIWKARYDCCLGGEKFSFVEEYQTPKGTKKQETFCSPILDEFGHVSGVSVISRDLREETAGISG